MRTLVTFLLLPWIALPATARADMADDCGQVDDPVLTLTACTEVIASGDWAGENLAWAYHNRGLAHRRQDDLEAAIADYGEAIALKPDYVDAYFNRAIAHDTAGDMQSALADLSVVIELQPDAADTYMVRGIIQANACAYDEAMADFDQALTLDPELAPAEERRGRLAAGDWPNSDRCAEDG